MKEMLIAGLYLAEQEDESIGDIKCISDFRQAGLLTNDEGIIVRMVDGREFQITIRQSK